ncbi:MAG TPA: S8 family serine peptidase [Candidatus Eisenbacteria bacterium]|nr:S8 family serine peptidase [Candidatus Eisenbacteria bacterium]
MCLAAPAGAQSLLKNIPQTHEPEFRAPGWVSDELLVQFRDAKDQNAMARAAREEGVDLREVVTTDGLARVSVTPGTDVPQSMKQWMRRDDVLYAAPNFQAHGFFVPNDTTIATFDLAWNLRAIDAYSAWDVVRGDPSIVLAIVDTGVAFEDHAVPPNESPFLWPGTTMYRQSPELPGPFLQGWDFVHDDAHPNDDNGHGTMCATLAAGLANNVAGSAGIAFGVTILPVKVLDYRADAQADDIVQGIRFAADHGANIMNLSLGFPPLTFFEFLGFTKQEVDQMFRPLREAIQYAQRRGVIIVAAAGNFDADEVSLPAGYPGVIAVGATGFDDLPASYTSSGKTLDIMAPGGDFTELNNDHVQDAIFNLSIKPNRSEGSLAKPDSFGVFPFFGTSGASPQVAGTVALLQSLGVKNQGSVEQTLYSTAKQPFVPNRGGWDPRDGYGLVQVGAAVRKAAAKGPASSAGAPGTLEARLLSGNPARGGAALSFTIRTEGRVRARVFNAKGELVRTMLDAVRSAGVHTVAWDGRDERGQAAPSGIYFLRIDANDAVATRKVAFLR